MALRCWFFLAWWLLLMLAVVVAEERAEDCLSKSCSRLTISEPFWLTDMETGISCGLLDFEVACQNNTPVLRSSGHYGFAILNIAYAEGSLRVVDLGKLKFLHNYSGSCYIPTWNTSAMVGSPFRVDHGNQDLIFYNCTEEASAAARRNGALAKTRMKCTNESEVFVRTGGSDYAVEGCHTIVVPVLGSSESDKANGSDYEQLIRDGFLLTWDGLPPLRLARYFPVCTFTPGWSTLQKPEHRDLYMAVCSRLEQVANDTSSIHGWRHDQLRIAPPSP